MSEGKVKLFNESKGFGFSVSPFSVYSVTFERKTKIGA